jgi:hypothetical protein
MTNRVAIIACLFVSGKPPSMSLQEPIILGTARFQYHPPRPCVFSMTIGQARADELQERGRWTHQRSFHQNLATTFITTFTTTFTTSLVLPGKHPKFIALRYCDFDDPVAGWTAR